MLYGLFGAFALIFGNSDTLQLVRRSNVKITRYNREIAQKTTFLSTIGASLVGVV